MKNRQLLYSIKAGLELNPYVICLVNANQLLDIKQLSIEKRYLNAPFLIELMLFNQEGDCIRYLKEDSYSFKLIKDVECMVEQILQDEVYTESA